jgi:hypothetical protein
MPGMAKVDGIIARLRREERKLEKQLAGIRNAIASLEFGSGGGVPETRKLSATRRQAVATRKKTYQARRKRG